MPFARIKPYNPKRGYKLRSYSNALGLRLVIGDDDKSPIWHHVTEKNAEILEAQRINDDPASPCKFDIFPTEKAAKEFELREKRKRSSDEGKTVSTAVMTKGVTVESAMGELESAKARIAELEAQLQLGNKTLTSTDMPRKGPGRPRAS